MPIRFTPVRLRCPLLTNQPIVELIVMLEPETDPGSVHSVQFPLLTAAIALAASAAVCGGCRLLAAPVPLFVWFDVTVVHLVGAVLPALLLASFVIVRLPTWLKAAAAFLLVLLAAGMAAAFDPSKTGSATYVDGLACAVARSMVALFVATAAAAIASIYACRQQGPARIGQWFLLPLALFTAFSFALLPAAYVASRCEYQTNRLREILDQSRLEEARRLAANILDLNPAAQFQGKPLRDWGRILEGQVRAITARVASPLPESASADEQLERARELAILDRVPEALALLLPLVERPQPSPEACVLQGTILQTTEDWNGALRWYRPLVKESAFPGKTGAATQLQIAATRGIAFCERKRGDYPAAEAAYLRLLQLSPRAETHFLLAQFYEDTQQAQRAGEHARRAITLAPARYQADGDRLIDRLVVRQFGCLAADSGSDTRQPGRY